MDENCPKVAKCRLFNNQILKRAESAETYRNLYCKAGQPRWSNCKRYMVSEKFGSCPDYILPNSTFSLDEIQNRMRKEGLLV